MSYQVLARKWRPGNFREMVGQEHVLRALINALDHNRLHHAYLFTGTRGVGKTTIARILAKCLNCEAGVTSTPCGECSSCVEISEGRFIDLIEVDAASRTKVEDTRELLDNVQYAPTRGRYKIYLIDEVHMLSNHSFNALLKTLEEPPEHVKFLLATTDPQKLPVTILSRCLQFNLKNMSPERIVGHLQNILDKEAVPFDDGALWLLARSADGSMRDGLSLTDQAIAFGSGKIGEADVASMLGTIDHQLIQNLMHGLLQGDGKLLLESVAKFAEHAPDFNAALAEFLTLLHRIAIAQALPEALDNSFGDRTQILEFATAMAAEDVQLFYQTALIGRRDLYLASDPRSGFEMTLLRMLAFKPQGVADIPTQTLLATTPENTAAAAVQNDASNFTGTGEPPAKKLHTETALESEVTTPSANAGSVGDVVSVQASDPQSFAPNTREPSAPVVPPHESPAVYESAATDESAVPNDPYIAQAEEPLAAPSPQSTAAVLPANNAQALLNAADAKQTNDASEIKQQLKDQIKAITGKEGIAPTAAVVEPPVEAKQKQAVEAQASAANEHRSATSDGAAPIGLDVLTPQHWSTVFRQLGVKGIVQNTASNCALIGKEGNQLFFALDENKSSLFDNSHNQRLAGLLSDYFQQPVKVDIHLQSLPEGVETPAQCAEREKIEQHAQALQTLTSDPVIQTLEREFGAVLDQQSVTVKR